MSNKVKNIRDFKAETKNSIDLENQVQILREAVEQQKKTIEDLQKTSGSEVSNYLLHAFERRRELTNGIERQYHLGKYTGKYIDHHLPPTQSWTTTQHKLKEKQEHFEMALCLSAILAAILIGILGVLFGISLSLGYGYLIG
jgi:hypothetical protein